MSGVDTFYVFLVSVACGTAGGLLYDAVTLLRSPFGGKWVRYGADLFFCGLFAALYLWVIVALGFPALRLYAFCACLIGFWLYAKSFHKIVELNEKKIYNRRKPIQKGKKLCQKRGARDLRRKKSEGS